MNRDYTGVRVSHIVKVDTSNWCMFGVLSHHKYIL